MGRRQQTDAGQKAALVTCMAENLPVLRAKLSLSQEELASKIGTTRQTVSVIECGQREMTWVTFLALVFVFSSSESTKQLLKTFGILTPELEASCGKAEND